MAKNNFSMDLEGVSKAVRDIQKYGGRKRKQVKDKIKTNARKIQTRAKKELKVGDSGDTKKSIKYKLLNDGFSATVGPRRPKGYKAFWIEFGTRSRTQKSTGRGTGKMKATPFMRPAFERVSPGYLKDLKELLGDEK